MAKRKAASPSLPTYAVVEWAAGRLKPYARNARLHSPEQINQLRGSFRQFGQVWPILVRADGTIIAGHGRLEAAKAEGFKTIKVIVASGWTDEQCRTFGLLDNRVPLNAEWDKEVLGMELSELQGLGLDLEAMGFEPGELSSLLPDHEGKTDPDDVPEPPANPVSRLGDLWILGRHRLLCGDSTKKEDVERVLGGVKPHLMVTDPPYGVEYDPAWRARAGINKNKAKLGKVSNDDRADWREAWVLFPGEVVYVWHGALHAAEVAESLDAAGFAVRAQIIWAKDRLVMGRGHYHWQHEPCWYAVAEKAGATGHWGGDRTQTTLWTIPSRDDAGHGHGTQKPVECMKRPIENNSSPGQAVYDPFVGSGTTIIAAEMTGRACISIDCDPVYVDVAIIRWQEFVGASAVLDGDGRDFESVAAERVPKAA